MPAQSKPLSPLRLRLATLFLPPLGLLLLWRRPHTWRRRLLGTVGIGLFSILYAAGVIFLLIRFTGLEVEWRGGPLPALTYHKTTPDYDALERHRAQSTHSPVAAQAQVAPPYWTGFRGPHGDGIYDEKPILTNWPASGLRLLWRQPIGGGYASFAIAEGLAFTIEQRREKEVVTAYDLQTGREVWTHGWPACFTEPMGGEGPRATPAYSEGNVYGLGAEGELRCLEAATGKLRWARNILLENHAPTPVYGVAASPLVVEEKLIVLSSAGHSHSVLCYSKRDGEPIWNSLDDVTGHASPMLVTLAGERQLIVCAENRTVGLRVEDGKLLWEYPWRVLNGQLPISQPVVLNTNRFLLSAGYATGCAVVEVEKAGSDMTAHQVWKNTNLKNKFNSSVFWQDHVYGLDEGVLTCVDAQSGQRAWKDGRYGYGQLLLASGQLVILSGEGELALVTAAPQQYQERARFQAIHGKTWNYPAIADGKLLVRNAVEMACFEIAR